MFLTYAQGREDAATWADYMNVGMEHGCFDMTGLEAYMRGPRGWRTDPVRTTARRPVIVEAPVNGIDENPCPDPAPGNSGKFLAGACTAILLVSG